MTKDFSRRGEEVRGSQHNVPFLHEQNCVEVCFLRLFVLAYTRVIVKKKFFILNSYIKFRFSFAFFKKKLLY